ncbi:MAG: hypothetical protein VX899_09980 [Myxococcota bacterium]|nr:hypothetical protein [Myxococcota bacterium]
MTEQTLVQWVRGELPAPERRRVTEWMIRCRDPQLPLLLDGILQAERDARRDAGLAARGAPWASFVAGWQTLLEQGRAVLLDAPAGTFALASDEAAPVELLQLLESDPGPMAVVTAPQPGHYHLIVTDDGGRVQRLGHQRLNAGQSFERELPQPGERSTLWALRTPDQSAAPAIALLQEALGGQGSAEVLGALRLDPRDT